MSKVLIIDDDASFREPLRNLLESEGYIVIEASDGVEGVEIYRNQHAVLVSMDIVMPRKDGVEAILDLKIDSNQHRAVYLATLNAVLAHLGMARGTIHCKNNEPEDCARQIADYIRKTWGEVKIGLIGLNPAIAETLAKTFGADRIFTTDLDYKNIGKHRFGIPIWDGRTRTEELVRECDFVLATGTTLGNGTFDGIWSLIQRYEKPYLFYGVTVAGISELMGINRICPYGADA